MNRIDRMADAALLRILAQIDRDTAAAHATIAARAGALKAHYARGVSINRSLGARLRRRPDPAAARPAAGEHTRRPRMSAIPITTTADPLADAVHSYIDAKRAEDAATELRLQAEQRLLALHPAREEGAESFEAGGYKVTLTGKLTYSCEDAKALAEACAGLGWPAHTIPVKTETKLDATGAKYLRAKEPHAWAQIAPFITVKPAKVAVQVKV